VRYLLFPAVWLFFSAASLLAHKTLDATSPTNLGPNGFDAGDYVYISGQGPRGPRGTTPANIPNQVRQCLENIRKAVETAGLSMDHVVYVQVYLEDITCFGELNDVFAKYFRHDPPARAVLGVSRLPQPPLQITAVAIRDLKGKQAGHLLAQCGAKQSVLSGDAHVRPPVCFLDAR
jgi:2-iminobutanoate/2-iminopropanoate deaminase